MRSAPTSVQKIIEPVVTSLGYELVGIEYFSQGRRSVLRIYIDHEAGVTLDDCQRVSHQVSGLLDVEDVIKGQYALEVSSPGSDRPLFTKEQFMRFTDKVVKVRLAIPIGGRRNFQGVLRGVDDGDVLLEVDDSQVRLPLNNIDRANVVPDY